MLHRGMRAPSVNAKCLPGGWVSRRTGSKSGKQPACVWQVEEGALGRQVVNVFGAQGEQGDRATRSWIASTGTS